MNSKQLTYFTVIAETGSFTAAAKELNLSQPPLSKQIMLLEEELDVRLFDRSSRSIRLTEAGALLYSRARDILNLMETAGKEVKGYQSSPGGVLKLGIISSSGTFLFQNFIQEYCRRYPGIRFEIYEGNTYQLLEKLKNGLIECALVRTPFNEEGLQCLHGRPEPLTAVGNPSYFTGMEEAGISLTDLAGKPLICYRRFDPIISVAFQNVGLVPNIFCRNDDARTCLLWAGTGLGIALVPRSISRIHLTADQTSQLVSRDIISEDTTTRMAVIARKSVSLTQAARCFMELFRETETASASNIL